MKEEKTRTGKKIYVLIAVFLLFFSVVVMASASDLVDEVIDEIEDFFEDDEYSILAMRTNATEVYDARGEEVEDDSEFIETISATESFTDTGLDSDDGVYLDWIDEGPIHYCLGINITQGVWGTDDLSLVVRDLDFDGTTISNQELFYGEIENVEYSLPEYVCEEERIESIETTEYLRNGSINSLYPDNYYMDYDCELIENEYEVRELVYSSIPINQTYRNRYSAMDTLTLDNEGFYKYCFDVPISLRSNGRFGSTGAVYVEFDGDTYVDFQNSSWWNASYEYKSPVWANRSVDTNDYESLAIHVNSSNGVFTNDCMINGTETNLSDSILGYIYYNDDTDYTFLDPTETEEISFFCEGDNTILNRTPSGIYDSTLTGNSWAFHENSGTTTTDFYSGNIATFNNNPEWADCLFGICLNYTRADSDALLITDPFLFAGGGTQNVWVNFKSAASTEYIFDQGDCYSLLYTNGGNDLQFSYGSSAVKTGESYDVGNWHMYTTQYDAANGSIRLYKDAQLLAEVATASPACTGTKSIGGRLATGHHYSDAYIDNFENWDVVMPEMWIKRKYNYTLSRFGETTNYTSTFPTVPYQSQPIINSTTGFNITVDNITIYNQSTTEPDGLRFKNIYAWRNNSVPLYAGYYPFEGGSNGTFTKDYSTRSFVNASVVGATYLNTSGVDGYGAYSFDGLNDCIFSNVNIDQSSTSQGVTFMAWVYPTVKDFSNRFIFGTWQGSWEWGFYRWQDNISIMDGTNTEVTRIYAPTNEWTHITVVYDPQHSEIRAYRNSKSVLILPDPPTFDTTDNDVAIGCNPIGAAYWKGLMDEVYIVNASLSNRQIEAIYNNQTNIIHNRTTRVGQTWTGYITPNNYAGDGDRMDANITIINGVPSLPTVTPNASFSTYEIENFSCSDSIDPDNDIINYEFWLNLTSPITIRQNNTNTTYLHQFIDGNGSYGFACRVNDAKGHSDFTGNISINFNNTILTSNFTNFTNTVNTGTNQMYYLNLTYNPIRVADIETIFVHAGNIGAVDEYNYSNLTAFRVNYFIPMNGSDGVSDFYFNVTTHDFNGSRHNFTYSYSQNTLGIDLFLTCNGTNSTVWAVLNVSIKDEENETLINGNLKSTLATWIQGNDPSTNITYHFELDDFNQTYICIDATNGSQLVQNAILQYEVDGYDIREYYLINQSLDNVTDDLVLYVLESSKASLIAHYVYDETDTPLEGFYILAQRYDVASDIYKTVVMGRADSEGKDVMSLRPNDAFYRYIIKNFTNVVYIDSIPRKIITDELFFRVTQNDFIENLRSFENIDYSLDFNNDTNIFSLVYVTNDNTITETSLVVKGYSVKDNLDTIVCTDSASSGSATLTCDIGNETSAYYIASIYSETSTIPKIIDTLEVDRTSGNALTANIGGTGLVLTLVIGVTAAFLGIFSPVISIVLVLVTFILLSLLGLINLGYGAILLLSLAGAFVISKLSR